MLSEDFIPFRRRVEYYECEEASILPLISFLLFIPNKKFWRYPIIEINVKDFKLICSRMRCRKKTLLA
jgi:hypothetical protein